MEVLDETQHLLCGRTQPDVVKHLKITFNWSVRNRREDLALPLQSHAGSAVARQTRTIKIPGFDSRSCQKSGTTETNFSCAYFHRGLGGSGNPLETVGPVVGAVASSNYRYQTNTLTTTRKEAFRAIDCE